MDSDCQFRSQLDAYHDGELTADASGQLTNHLAACATCREQVAALKRISELFAGDPGGDIQLAAMARLHEAVDAEPARDYFRTARLLIGLAASVLIIGTVWLSQTPATSPRLQRGSIASVHTQDWEMVALNPRSYTPPNGMTSIPGDESRYAEAEVIHYMLQNLEGGPSHGNP